MNEGGSGRKIYGRNIPGQAQREVCRPRWAAQDLLAVQPEGHVARVRGAAKVWRQATDTEPCIVGNLDVTGLHCGVEQRIN